MVAQIVGERVPRPMIRVVQGTGVCDGFGGARGPSEQQGNCSTAPFAGEGAGWRDDRRGRTG